MSDGSLLMVVERPDGRLFVQGLNRDGDALDVLVVGTGDAEVGTAAESSPTNP